MKIEQLQVLYKLDMTIPECQDFPYNAVKKSLQDYLDLGYAVVWSFGLFCICLFLLSLQTPNYAESFTPLLIAIVSVGLIMAVVSLLHLLETRKKLKGYCQALEDLRGSYGHHTSWSELLDQDKDALSKRAIEALGNQAYLTVWHQRDNPTSSNGENHRRRFGRMFETFCRFSLVSRNHTWARYFDPAVARYEAEQAEKARSQTEVEATIETLITSPTPGTPPTKVS